MDFYGFAALGIMNQGGGKWGSVCRDNLMDYLKLLMWSMRILELIAGLVQTILLILLFETVFLYSICVRSSAG